MRCWYRIIQVPVLYNCSASIDWQNGDSKVVHYNRDVLGTCNAFKDRTVSLLCISPQISTGTLTAVATEVYGADTTFTFAAGTLNPADLDKPDLRCVVVNKIDDFDPSIGIHQLVCIDRITRHLFCVLVNVR